MQAARYSAGMALILALIGAGLWAFENYATLAAVDAWSGLDGLRALRPYLAEFRIPLLAALGFLSLSLVSWIWGRLGLGK